MGGRVPERTLGRNEPEIMTNLVIEFITGARWVTLTADRPGNLSATERAEGSPDRRRKPPHEPPDRPPIHPPKPPRKPPHEPPDRPTENPPPRVPPELPEDSSPRPGRERERATQSLFEPPLRAGLHAVTAASRRGFGRSKNDNADAVTRRG